MARSKQQKTIRYFRAVFDGNLRDLQDLMRRGRSFAPSCAGSELDMDGSTTVFIQHYRQPYSGSGCYVHLASFNAGDMAKIIKPSNEVSEDDGSAQAARRHHEFVVGECYLNIQGANVIFCSHGISRAMCITYLRKLFHASGIDREDYGFDLSAVGNVDKLGVIERHGVKSIDLSCSVFEMSRALLAGEERSWAKRILKNASSVVDAMIGQDDSIAEQRASEDLVVDLSVKLEGASRADIGAREHIKRMASEIVSADGEEVQEFAITTMNDERLTSSDISLLRKVVVDRQSNSLDYDSVFGELTKFRTDLEAENLIEQ